MNAMIFVFIVLQSLILAQAISIGFSNPTNANTNAIYNPTTIAAVNANTNADYNPTHANYNPTNAYTNGPSASSSAPVDVCIIQMQFNLAMSQFLDSDQDTINYIIGKYVSALKHNAEDVYFKILSDPLNRDTFDSLRDAFVLSNDTDVKRALAQFDSLILYPWKSSNLQIASVCDWYTQVTQAINALPNEVQGDAINFAQLVIQGFLQITDSTYQGVLKKYHKLVKKVEDNSYTCSDWRTLLGFIGVAVNCFDVPKNQDMCDNQNSLDSAISAFSTDANIQYATDLVANSLSNLAIIFSNGVSAAFQSDKYGRIAQHLYAHDPSAARNLQYGVFNYPAGPSISNMCDFQQQLDDAYSQFSPKNVKEAKKLVHAVLQYVTDRINVNYALTKLLDGDISISMDQVETEQTVCNITNSLGITLSYSGC